MTYLELFKTNRQQIIDTLQSRRVDVKTGMQMLVELNKGDATFFVTQICEGEEDAVNELLEIVIPKIIQEEGRAASFRLEEMAIEANNNLKKSI